jgi:Ca-activated chloride channel family protein
MGGLTFASRHWVHLVWVALAIVAVLAALELRARDTLARFVSSAMQSRLAERQTPARRAGKLGLVLATLLLGTLALMRPQVAGGARVPSTRQVTADILVVLDVSRSMLAEDAAPNRLARAKAEITEFVERVQGHRVGLVVFAGRASVKCPLTSDYGFFHLALRDVDSTSAGKGGTRIGDAIRKALAVYGPGSGAPRVMLLITDGEDHDSFPLDAARAAVEAGVRIVTIGFGSEEGSEIMLTDPQTGARTLLADRDGRVVRSRLDGELLREIALATEGVYVPAGTSALDLDSIVEAHVEPLVTDSAVQRSRPVVVEHYRWFVMAALAALVAAVWIGSSSGARRSAA